MTDIEKAARAALGSELYDALAGRRHPASDMLSMEPLERFKEYCAWHLGDRGWGTQLAEIWKAANFDGDQP